MGSDGILPVAEWALTAFVCHGLGRRRAKNAISRWPIDDYHFTTPSFESLTPNIHLEVTVSLHFLRSFMCLVHSLITFPHIISARMPQRKDELSDCIAELDHSTLWDLGKVDSVWSLRVDLRDPIQRDLGKECSHQLCSSGPM